MGGEGREGELTINWHWNDLLNKLIKSRPRNEQRTAVKKNPTMSCYNTLQHKFKRFKSELFCRFKDKIINAKESCGLEEGGEGVSSPDNRIITPSINICKVQDNFPS